MTRVLHRTMGLVAGVAAAVALGSCGSTPSDDATVLELVGFSDEGLTQCDEVLSDPVEVDVIVDACDDTACAIPSDTTTREPFTETFVTASLQNNQKLDITIDRYTVAIEGSSVPTKTYTGSTTVRGRRCSNDSTRGCATNTDCILLGGGTGLCQASISPVVLRIFDFTTKDQIIPSAAPFGKTFNTIVTMYGSDVTGGDWVAQGSLSARFQDFCNCGCTLTQ